MISNDVQFEAQIREAIRNAKALIDLVGLTEAVRERSASNARWIIWWSPKAGGAYARGCRITLTFEMNTPRSHPGYFLVYSDQGATWQTIGSPSETAL